MPREIISRFAGHCSKCNGDIPAGVKVSWDTETRKVSHLGGCPARVARPLPVAALAAPLVCASPIAAFIGAAKDRGLKAPKARFLAPNGGEMRLALAGAKAKNPGAVKVDIAGVWIGNIETTGNVIGPLARPGYKPVLDAIELIALDPAAAAKAYGKLMGRCSFCNLPLTDDRSGSSVEVGYGPVCAKKFGLPHHPKGARPELHTLPLAGAL
jgi:hypothetical protein